MRKWVFVFFIFNFLLLVASISGLPREAFDLSLVHGTLMAFVLILLSFWVWRDGVEIENLRELVDRLMQEKAKESR